MVCCSGLCCAVLGGLGWVVMMSRAAWPCVPRCPVVPNHARSHPTPHRYTNGVMTASLRFCVDAHKALGLQYPSEWSDIASRPYLPLVLGLDPSGPSTLRCARSMKLAVLHSSADVCVVTCP